MKSATRERIASKMIQGKYGTSLPKLLGSSPQNYGISGTQQLSDSQQLFINIMKEASLAFCLGAVGGAIITVAASQSGFVESVGLEGRGSNTFEGRDVGEITGSKAGKTAVKQTARRSVYG